jgi:hypothetical protein
MSATWPPDGSVEIPDELVAEIEDEALRMLREELRGVVRRYRRFLWETYQMAEHWGALDERLDSIVAAVIEELEGAGYVFNPARLGQALVE